MAKIGGILVCLVIVGLDVAAAILGIQAEVSQNQVPYIIISQIIGLFSPIHDDNDICTKKLLCYKIFFTNSGPQYIHVQFF